LPWRRSAQSQASCWTPQVWQSVRQRSPETRRTYAAVYRTFCTFLGPGATAEDLTAETVRAYRDQLERASRTPATIAKHLSALRQLATAVDADPAIRTVRSQSVARGEPRALSEEDFARLLRMPDRRTRRGKRDLALLHLLGSDGLRRADAANLLIADVDERRRAGDPRLRQAIARSTSWWVTVRYGKRGRSCVRARPPAATRRSSSSSCVTRASATARATPRAAPMWSSATPSASPAPTTGRRSVWYGGGRLARDLPPCSVAWAATRRRGQAAGGKRVGLADTGRAAVARGAPGRARAAHCDVAPVHDGTGANRRTALYCRRGNLHLASVASTIERGVAASPPVAEYRTVWLGRNPWPV
jgi:hypothetical protein